jgi:methylmalonyl-CoA mutase C-terminal domain/subunit
MTLFPRVMEALHQRRPVDDEVLVFGGGIIPAADVTCLKELGVAEIFGPGATMASVCDWLESTLDHRQEAAHGSF